MCTCVFNVQDLVLIEHIVVTNSSTPLTTRCSRRAARHDWHPQEWAVGSVHRAFRLKAVQLEL